MELHSAGLCGAALNGVQARHAIKSWHWSAPPGCHGGSAACMVPGWWQLSEVATTQMASKLKCRRAELEEHTCSWRPRACHRVACMAMALHAAPDCHDAASSPSCTTSTWMFACLLQAGGGVGTSRLSRRQEANKAAPKRGPSPDSDIVIIV